MCIYGWEYHEGMRPFEDFCRQEANDGDKIIKSFILTGLGNIELWTADPEISSEILRRPDEFKQQPVTQKILSAFGDNVFTTGM